MRSHSFETGMDRILRRRIGAGQRVGLVSHVAAMTRKGFTAAEAWYRRSDSHLSALFSPEHGYFGSAGAGEAIRSIRFPHWKIPLHSLYGARHEPSPAHLRGLSLLIVDLQDLGARCYTYLSTLVGVLRAAARARLPLIVADRPIPLPFLPDGPLLDPRFASFVGLAPVPMATAMTPAETALYLQKVWDLNVDLEVVPMRGWPRTPYRGPDWPPWVPPSPGIRSWESAACYLATVFTEAVPTVTCDRTGLLPFQVFGAPWIKAPEVIPMLEAAHLPGVAFHVHPFRPNTGPWAGRLLSGVRLVITDPRRFRPVRLSVFILATLQKQYGKNRLWSNARPDFFDKLYGTNEVRLALLDGDPPDQIARRWQPGLRRFNHVRSSILLYRPA
jgi:uncharacterized protein YbbC (DUF1343 family)